MPSFEYEEKRYAEGYGAVCGCDEAGRGPLCGPVVAAAVILPRGCVIEGLDDSKKLTERKREVLFEVIKEKAVAYGVDIAHEVTMCGESVMFIRDPDGVLVELIQPPV